MYYVRLQLLVQGAESFIVKLKFRLLQHVRRTVNTRAQFSPARCYGDYLRKVILRDILD